MLNSVRRERALKLRDESDYLLEDAAPHGFDIGKLRCPHIPGNGNGANVAGTQEGDGAPGSVQPIFTTP